MCLVEGQQGGGDAGGGGEEIAPAQAEAPGIHTSLLDGALVGDDAVSLEGPRLELAVAGGIQLDRQAAAVRIETGLPVVANAAFSGHGGLSWTS